MATDNDQILDLGARWAAAELDADVATLERIVTDDFRLVGPFGFVLDKEQWLDRYRSGDLSTTALEWRDIDVRTYRDAAITIATQTQHASYRGSPTNGDFRVTHVFVRPGDDWTIASIHLSLTAPLRPAAAPSRDT
jgi:ketosteroid isomerase-like protein